MESFRTVFLPRFGLKPAGGGYKKIDLGKKLTVQKVKKPGASVLLGGWTEIAPKLT